MIWPPDYHMHTPLCRHARGEPVEYAARAIREGLTEIGFSDHSPMPRDDFDNWRMRLDQLDEYVAKVREAQHRFPQLSVRLGLEVDYLPGEEGWIQDLAGRHPWDYFIGSVHYIGDAWDIDNPEKLSEWKKRPPIEVWQAYFERLAQAAASGCFQILGHADLPKKFCFYPEEDCSGLYTAFLAEARRTGTAIELNTAGLRKDCREIYPSAAILELAHRNQVGITFGSDAHRPEEVGLNFNEAVRAAQRAGYTEFCRFEGRRRIMVALPLMDGPGVR